MFWNNVIVALRNLRKNKLFATINILGLAIGLTIYVFGGLLVKYERTHDMFFENASLDIIPGTWIVALVAILLGFIFIVAVSTITL